MELFFYFFIFSIGAAIGSFLGVIVDRSIEGKTVVSGRSVCDYCGHKLGPLDLIPVLSYAFLLGRCRHCHKHISWYYPLIEIVTGISFVFVVFSVLGYNLSLVLYDWRYILVAFYFLFITSSLIVVFFTDLEFGIIPFKVVFVAIVATFLWYFLLPVLHLDQLHIPFLALEGNYLFSYLISALGAFLFFFLIFLLTKGRGMGFGDVVYVFLMGFVLGFPNILLGFYIAFLTGAVVSVFLVVAGIKKLKGGTIPFGPFLVFGTMVSLLWGKFFIEKIMVYLGGA